MMMLGMMLCFAGKRGKSCHFILFGRAGRGTSMGAGGAPRGSTPQGGPKSKGGLFGSRGQTRYMLMH